MRQILCKSNFYITFQHYCGIGHAHKKRNKRKSELFCLHKKDLTFVFFSCISYSWDVLWFCRFCQKLRKQLNKKKTITSSSWAFLRDFMSPEKDKAKKASKPNRHVLGDQLMWETNQKANRFLKECSIDNICAGWLKWQRPQENCFRNQTKKDAHNKKKENSFCSNLKN